MVSVPRLPGELSFCKNVIECFRLWFASAGLVTRARPAGPIGRLTLSLLSLPGVAKPIQNSCAGDYKPLAQPDSWNGSAPQTCINAMSADAKNEREFIGRHR